jgi:hypothetical protein
VIGHDQRDRVITDETRLILRSDGLSLVDASFLIEVDRMSEAETYVLERSPLLEREHYAHLLAVVEPMETAGRSLGASAVYRALTNATLARGVSKYYGYAVHYVKKLDWLARKLDRWHGIESHAAYMAILREKHGRKTAFWSRYEP